MFSWELLRLRQTLVFFQTSWAWYSQKSGREARLGEKPKYLSFYLLSNPIYSFLISPQIFYQILRFLLPHKCPVSAYLGLSLQLLLPTPNQERRRVRVSFWQPTIQIFLLLWTKTKIEFTWVEQAVASNPRYIDKKSKIQNNGPVWFYFLAHAVDLTIKINVMLMMI